MSARSRGQKNVLYVWDGIVRAELRKKTFGVGKEMKLRNLILHVMGTKECWN